MAITTNYVGTYPSVLFDSYEIVTVIFNDTQDVSFRSTISGIQWANMMGDIFRSVPDTTVKVITSDEIDGGELQIVRVGDAKFRLVLTPTQRAEAHEYRSKYEAVGKCYYYDTPDGRKAAGK